MSKGRRDIAKIGSKSDLNVVGAMRFALSLLGPRDRLKFALVVSMQMCLSVFDLIGVLLLGLVGFLAALSIQSSVVPIWFERLQLNLHLQEWSLINLTMMIALVGATFLICKSLLSLSLTRRTYRFLGTQQAQVSIRLTKCLVNSQLSWMESRPSQETAYSLTKAVSITIVSLLGASSIALSEAALLILLGAALLIINPAVTFAAILFFGLVGLTLQVGLRRWLDRVGVEIGETTVLGQQRLQEFLAAYREVTVLDRKDEYLQNLTKLWMRSGAAQGDEMFIMQVPKIAYESTLVLGAIALTGWQFATGTPAQAIAVLALFMASATRILPSMLRLSSMVFYIRSGSAQASLLRPIAHDLLNTETKISEDKKGTRMPGQDTKVFVPKISLKDVYARHGNSQSYSLKNISLEITEGTHVALVGPTGAGKSTLADVILGILRPESGSVLVSKRSPETAIRTWPGLIAYVPQEVSLMSGTIRENVALGINPSDVDDLRVSQVLKQVDLEEFLRTERHGLETVIGERGTKLSGGQRQRLGLARALYSSPRLLVLDEATSALDAQTEHLISTVLGSLSNSVTTITIAHRLATVKSADLVLYLEKGEILARGTFEEVRSRNAAFAEQANLLGV